MSRLSELESFLLRFESESLFSPRLRPQRRLCGAKHSRNSALIVIFLAMSLVSPNLDKSIDFNLLIQTTVKGWLELVSSMRYTIDARFITVCNESFEHFF